MRIALAQINTTVGALESNADRMLRAYRGAERKHADLVVFPELALTGYPPKDLLEIPSFVQRNVHALENLAVQMTGPGAVIGYVQPHESATGKGRYNAAALIDAGQIISRHYKALLPTYDVFDEARYFDSAPQPRLAEFRGRRLSITICEDFWSNFLYGPNQRLYSRHPVDELAKQGAEIMIHIASSPFSVGKRRIKARMYEEATRRWGIPLVQVNVVGGNDNLIFDGWSNVWGVKGGILAQATQFREELLLWDWTGEHQAGGTPPLVEDDEETLCEALKLGIHDYVGKCGFKRVLIGLSGGIDSALTAALAAQALGPENVVGISMPSQFSSDHSRTDAQRLAENLGIEYHVIPIAPVYESLLGQLQPLFAGTEFGLAEENLQSRARGNLLMALSNKFNWLVLSTGNKSEMAVGYCTLYGDMSGGLSVLGDVLKTSVYALSCWINREHEIIPRSIIDKAPSAELRPNQFDTDSLPPYDQLDPIIEAYIERHESPDEIVARGFPAPLVKRVVRMIDRAEYKRQQAPVMLKVTGKAFDTGRRMPIARGYDW